MSKEKNRCCQLVQRTTSHAAKEGTKSTKLGDLKRRLMCMGDHFAVGKARLWKFSCQKQTEAKNGKTTPNYYARLLKNLRFNCSSGPIC